MARTVRDHRLDNRTQRLRLTPRAEPYWTLLSEGAHLGYYRGKQVAKWVARYRPPGRAGGYDKTTLGETDDYMDADGERFLDFRLAQAAAREWCDDKARGGRRAGPYTIGAALDDYLAAFTKKSLESTRNRIEAIIRPALGSIDANDLTAKRIRDWHLERARSPARLRTAAAAEKQNLRPLDSREAERKRKVTANRDLTVLKAALNLAYANEKIRSADAWRKVKPFPDVERAKLRYLSDDEARRLVNAADPDFRRLVQASLLTGGRYGELCATTVADFDARAGTLNFADPKGAPRRVYLEDECLRLMETLTAGKAGDAPIFVRADGEPWRASHQNRRMADACARAKIAPVATFHDIRRTFGARLALRGVPMAVIAQAMGHADERITARHYAHLSPNYVAETVRANAGGLDIVERSNVENIGKGRT
ncbi:MAG: tyrosine-type recombinase/integrase [Alphaproteobacteria bacterium]|nr:tyrosine-type recombinase/integrase [Alphaproteobacteria bacterium]